MYIYNNIINKVQKTTTTFQVKSKDYNERSQQVHIISINVIYTFVCYFIHFCTIFVTKVILQDEK